MIARHRDRKKEWARNFFLAILAVGVVVVFFNLDIMDKGKSVFSMTADRKLKFSGKLTHRDFTKKEFTKLLNYTKKHNDIFDKVSIEASPQDSYKKISPSTQILYEIHVILTDGGTLSTPVRRTTRKNLVKSIITKLNKDTRDYLEIKGQGKKFKSFINTM